MNKTLLFKLLSIATIIFFQVCVYSGSRAAIQGVKMTAETATKKVFTKHNSQTILDILKKISEEDNSFKNIGDRRQQLIYEIQKLDFQRYNSLSNRDLIREVLLKINNLPEKDFSLQDRKFITEMTERLKKQLGLSSKIQESDKNIAKLARLRESFNSEAKNHVMFDI